LLSRMTLKIQLK